MNDDYRESTRRYIYKMNLFDKFDRTLFLKWMELQRNPNEFELFYTLKPKIFNPQSVEEIETVNIQIVPVTSENSEIYRSLYKFTSSGLYNGAPARRMSYLVKDGTSNKYMGLITQQSDPSPALSSRDNFIGWTTDDRMVGRKLNHVYNGQTLVAFKPFSYNCLGGKLLVRLFTTDYFRSAWLTKYGELPVAAITTSLYGSETRQTQYDNLKGWYNLGQTAGRTPLYIPKELFDRWKSDYNVQTGTLGNGVRCDQHRRDVATVISKELKLPMDFLSHNILRGVYWCPFYRNTNAFLCGRIDESKLKLVPNINDMDYQVEKWKKEATYRFKSLQDKERIKKTATYYTVAVNSSFDQMRRLFKTELSQSNRDTEEVTVTE